jgi:hypothetical protein
VDRLVEIVAVNISEGVVQASCLAFHPSCLYNDENMDRSEASADWGHVVCALDNVVVAAAVGDIFAVGDTVDDDGVVNDGEAYAVVAMDAFDVVAYSLVDVHTYFVVDVVDDSDAFGVAFHHGVGAADPSFRHPFVVPLDCEEGVADPAAAVVVLELLVNVVDHKHSGLDFELVAHHYYY